MRILYILSMFPAFMIVNPKYLALGIEKFVMIDMSFIDWIEKKI